MARTIIKYVDDRPIYFPALSSYPRGLEIEKGDTLKVNDEELKYFMRQKNGKTNCFVKEMKRPTPERKTENTEVSE